jgi:hypothetical protein
MMESSLDGSNVAGTDWLPRPAAGLRRDPGKTKIPSGWPLAPSNVRARPLADREIGEVAALLHQGFGHRSSQFWLECLKRLAERGPLDDLPKYGLGLECDESLVGVILLISSAFQQNESFRIRCNLSSWYVERSFRCYAPLLITQALRRKNITYVNISPAPHTRRTIEAQGFTRYSNGLFVAPLLPMTSSQEVTILGSDAVPDAPFELFERDLLLEHAQYGCLSLWCVASERAYPFVFCPRIVRGVIPCVKLVYCRDVQDFVRFARPLGSYLTRRGRLFALIDSNGPICGLIGKYFDGVGPKYFRGPTAPRLGDLAFTEAALFGV